MLFQSLFELAEDSSLTAEEYMAQAEEFLRVSALEDGETDPNDLVDALECHLRYDILESIKDHPVYGERAKEKLVFKKFMDDSKAMENARIAALPPIFKEMLDVLKSTSKIGIYGLSYPSQYAMSSGCGDRNFAISGDGLFMFMFEIVSLENRGLFKLVKRPKDPARPELDEYEGMDCKNFRRSGNWEFGNILTGDQVIDTLKKIYPS
jgi:hypothetical protein